MILYKKQYQHFIIKNKNFYVSIVLKKINFENLKINISLKLI